MYYDVIQKMRELEVQPACRVTGDLLNVLENEFGDLIYTVPLENDQKAYQLDRFHTTERIIKRMVDRRVNAPRHEGQIPWTKRLDAHFKEEDPNIDESEHNARIEKAAALSELYGSRFSVLIGPAGTGKTTLLKILCEEPTVNDGGVLLLAPTGKARARMEIQTGIRGAQTIAQFLLPYGRYDVDTGAYRVQGTDSYRGAETVIIDESSMLTEEQLGAVIETLSGVQRLILVGDPRQLPPIGAGRPFLDIVKHLQPLNIDAKFPKIGAGYAELTVGRRQRSVSGEWREDTLLADWFSGRVLDPGADEIWSRITEDHVSDHLRFVSWENAQDLRKKLLVALIEELSLTGLYDAAGFEKSIGGVESKGWVYFNAAWNGRPGSSEKIENWQILSPVRNESHGVGLINRFIQETYRADAKKRARDWRGKTPKPMGREEIIYGDKVINIRNHRRKYVRPKEEALQYIANGEIGTVVGEFRYSTSKTQKKPKRLEVEFSSQTGYSYQYFESDFKEEGEPLLELAYALTVHKVQGSEFKTTFLIIPEPCRLLSKELLYTGLTRQQDRLIIFHQGDRHNLKKYSTDGHSDSVRRLTNLFKRPRPVELQNQFMEEGLIHKTNKGDSVRSKSEMIIAELLFQNGIDYKYEEPLPGQDGSVRYPDFTFYDDELGRKIIWEHLGLLHKPEYQERWKKKLAWYRNQGILPLDEAEANARQILIVTKDGPEEGINLPEITQMLNDLLDLE